MVKTKETFNWDNTEILFITKNDENVPEGCMKEALCVWDDNNIIHLDSWDNMNYDGKETRVISTPLHKLEYALACLRDDNLIEDVIRELCPEITDIYVDYDRYVTKNYLRHWMEVKGFTLEEFITNSKYVVISGNPYRHPAHQLINLNLIDIDNLEYCSDKDIQKLIEENKEEE